MSSFRAKGLISIPKCSGDPSSKIKWRRQRHPFCSWPVQTCLERRFEILTAVLQGYSSQCDAVRDCMMFCITSVPSVHHTHTSPRYSVEQNQAVFATTISSETQSYLIEFVPPHIVKADRGDDVQLHSAGLALDGGKCAASRHGRCTSGENRH